MKLALAQVNPTVGDFSGNIEMVIKRIDEAKRSGIQLLAFPEMVVTGYPPQDLLYEKAFVRRNKDALREIESHTKDVVVIIGFVDHDEKWRLYNSAAIFENGKLVHVVHKTLLPTYDVFDEARYFQPGRESELAPIAVKVAEFEFKLGVEICEDLWDEEYDLKVTDTLCSMGANIIVNISSSPFHIAKRYERETLVKEKAKKNGVPVFLVNLVGGQDELVFDGQSLGADGQGNMIAYGPQFRESLVVVDLDLENGTASHVLPPIYNEFEEMYNALVLGIRDYFKKTGFKRAVLGLSGGIDSAVTACIAADALGAENLIGVSMPSRFSSVHSKTDAEELANNLGVLYVKFPIQAIVDTYERVLDEPQDMIRVHFGIDESSDDSVADENIQPRVRGNSLMDFSNRFKDLKILVLNTGNKTELALGYCTLYGDMTGGVGVIGDVSKLDVYALAEYINRRKGRDVIPRSSIEKPPSAELKEDQYDPFDFDIVSPMVDDIVENRLGKQELLDKGYPPDIVEDVYSRVRNAEYKRWQAPPCIRITKKAFGMGWKMPIVNHYRE